MTLWSASNLDAFLASPLARDIIVEDGSVQGLTIRGVYRSPFASVPAGDIGVESSEPRVKVKTTDIDGIVEHGTGIYIADTGIDDFIVSGIQPAGTGWTLLILRAREV